MKSIKIYSTPTCPYCKMAKEYLTEKNYTFTDIDVTQDENAAKEIVEKSGQMGVPVLFIGEEMIIGFDKPKIDAALKQLGR